MSKGKDKGLFSQKSRLEKLEILSREELELERLKQQKAKLERKKEKNRKRNKKKKHIRLQQIKAEVEQSLNDLLHKTNNKLQLKNNEESYINKFKGRSKELKKSQIDYEELVKKVQHKVERDENNLFWNFRRLEENKVEELLLENYNVNESMVLNTEIEDREFKKLSEIKKTIMTDFLETNVNVRSFGYWKSRGKVYMKSTLLQEFEEFQSKNKLENAGKNETMSDNKIDGEGDKPAAGFQGLDSLENSEFDWDTNVLNSDFGGFGGKFFRECMW
jgi:hypothetical protein